MFRSGEIVHAAFPFTDLSSNKRRPCLILAQSNSPDDFFVAFITSAPTVSGSRCAVAVNATHSDWAKTGLKRPSFVRVDKLTTLHVSVISGAIGVLPEDLMRSVRQKLRLLLWPIEPSNLKE
jgi:mRNA interferase MazF